MSPALRIAFALRDAPCDEKLALVDDAVKEGDERALFGLDVVAHGCVKDPKRIDPAIRALRERLDRERTALPKKEAP